MKYYREMLIFSRNKETNFQDLDGTLSEQTIINRMKYEFELLW